MSGSSFNALQKVTKYITPVYTVYFKYSFRIRNFKYLLAFYLFLIHLSEFFPFNRYIFLLQSDVSDLATRMATPHARYQSAWTRSDIQVEVTSQCLSCDGALQSTKIKTSIFQKYYLFSYQYASACKFTHFLFSTKVLLSTFTIEMTEK